MSASLRSGAVGNTGLAGKLGLAAAATLLSLLGAEAAFRIFDLGAPPPLEGPATLTDAEGAGDERRNSFGFRGPEWTAQAAPGTARLVFLGDSFTYGRGIPEEDLFASRVARELSARGIPAESLNLSKPGWDTADEIEALRRVGIALHPDLVILIFFLNDATHLDSNPVIAWRMNREVAHRDGWLLNRASRLYDTWDYIIRKRRVSAETVRDYRESYLGSPDKRVLWERCRSAIEQGRDLALQERSRLAIAIFPMLVSLDSNYPFRDVHDEVAAECRRLGVPVLDLLQAFEGRDGPSLWITPDNAHPNVEGHAIAGGAIADFIIGESLADSWRRQGALLDTPEEPLIIGAANGPDRGLPAGRLLEHGRR